MAFTQHFHTRRHDSLIFEFSNISPGLNDSYTKFNYSTLLCFVFNDVLEADLSIVYPFNRQSSYILDMSMYPVLFFVRLNQIELIIDIMTCKFEKPSLWPKV